ncbi:hypothetical protein EVAR_16758_1 [Eumeta japonica]|uniref:Uncharacterized protein n=1 Tax=Eumeta variegata TaxID=151549 RepID=A0A4C1UL93_EUMVA|nr:hypothetical protein EVAR_16758_1 [Eumeta japonica]
MKASEQINECASTAAAGATEAMQVDDVIASTSMLDDIDIDYNTWLSLRMGIYDLGSHSCIAGLLGKNRIFDGIDGGRVVRWRMKWAIKPY